MNYRVTAIFVALSALFCAQHAEAAPGFYVNLGLGPSVSKGGDIAVSQVPFSTKLPVSPAFGLKFGYNILGYAAIEAHAIGQGTSLNKSVARTWAAQVGLGARLYPAWHFRDHFPDILKPLEPSLYLGVDIAAYQSKSPCGSPQTEGEKAFCGQFGAVDSDPLGFSTFGAFRWGLGLEYFLLDYLKVGIDYQMSVPKYDTLILNFNNGTEASLNPREGAHFHQVFFFVGFQVGAQPEKAAAPAHGDAEQN